MVSIFKSLAQIAAAILDLLIEIGKAMHFSLLIAVYALIVSPVYLAGLVVYFISIGLADQVNRGASGRNFYPEEEGLKPFEYYLSLGGEDHPISKKDHNVNYYIPDELPKKPKEFVIPELTKQERDDVDKTGIVPLNMLKKHLLKEIRNLALGFGLNYVEIYYSGSFGDKIVISHNCERDDGQFQRFLDLGIFSDMYINLIEQAKISAYILYNVDNKKTEDISLEKLLEIIKNRWQNGDFDDDF